MQKKQKGEDIISYLLKLTIVSFVGNEVRKIAKQIKQFSEKKY